MHASVNGHDTAILYDTGASVCFVRPGSILLESAQECSEANSSCASGGVTIALGDDSKVVTQACKKLHFSVNGQSHDYDYHVMPLPRGIDVIVGMDYMIENDVILLSRSQTVMFGGTLCCYGKPESHQNELETADVSHDSLGRMAVDTITESVVPVPTMCDVPAVSETSPRSRDLNVDIVNGVNSGSPGTQSSSGAAPSPASVALAPGHDQHLAVNAVSTASQPVKTAKARRGKDPQSVEYQRYKIQNERLKWPQDDPGINASDALQRNLSLSWNEERLANPGRYRHWCPPGHIRQKLYSMALDRDTVLAQARVASMKEQQKGHCDSQPSLLSQLNDMVEVDVVDSAVFDKLMSMKPSKSGSTCEMWLAYCDLAKRPESERKWAG